MLHSSTGQPWIKGDAALHQSRARERRDQSEFARRRRTIRRTATALIDFADVKTRSQFSLALVRAARCGLRRWPIARAELAGRRARVVRHAVVNRRVLLRTGNHERDAVLIADATVGGQDNVRLSDVRDGRQRFCRRARGGEVLILAATTLRLEMAGYYFFRHLAFLLLAMSSLIGRSGLGGIGLGLFTGSPTTNARRSRGAWLGSPMGISFCRLRLIIRFSPP